MCSWPLKYICKLKRRACSLDAAGGSEAAGCAAGQCPVLAPAGCSNSQGMATSQAYLWVNQMLDAYCSVWQQVDRYIHMHRVQVSNDQASVFYLLLHITHSGATQPVAWCSLRQLGAVCRQGRAADQLTCLKSALHHCQVMPSKPLWRYTAAVSLYHGGCAFGALQMAHGQGCWTCSWGFCQGKCWRRKSSLTAQGSRCCGACSQKQTTQTDVVSSTEHSTGWCRS